MTTFAWPRPNRERPHACTACVRKCLYTEYTRAKGVGGNETGILGARSCGPPKLRALRLSDKPVSNDITRQTTDSVWTNVSFGWMAKYMWASFCLWTQPFCRPARVCFAENKKNCALAVIAMLHLQTHIRRTQNNEREGSLANVFVMGTLRIMSLLWVVLDLYCRFFFNSFYFTRFRTEQKSNHSTVLSIKSYQLL